MKFSTKVNWNSIRKTVNENENMSSIFRCQYVVLLNTYNRILKICFIFFLPWIQMEWFVSDSLHPSGQKHVFPPGIGIQRWSQEANCEVDEKECSEECGGQRVDETAIQKY